MIETIATIEHNEELAPGFRLLVLAFEAPIEIRAGQFAMLKAHGTEEPLLRRALAVYKVNGPRRLSFLYQVMGRGTRALSHLGPGGRVETLLPLGNSWPMPSPVSVPSIHSTGPSTGKPAIVVAGGVGSASVFMLCEELARFGVETRVFFGAATRSALIGCGLEDFKSLGLPLTLATDDGSEGERGFVTAPLTRYLQEAEPAGATIYACGPWVMMARVSEIAAGFKLPCAVSLEAPMGCGFGVCVGCVVAVKTEGPVGFDSYKRVCTDGSIFPAETIRWDVTAMTH
jgi:dihydroorotate dehydrogenase electron transfer subunit